MKFYNYAETLAMLNEVADEMGRDTVYRDLREADMPDEIGATCYNVHKRADGTVVPGCIVGQVVVKKLGVPALELWEDSDGYTGTKGMGAFGIAAWLYNNDRAHLTAKARELLHGVQVKQDTGYAWGNAIAMAVEEVDRMGPISDYK